VKIALVCIAAIIVTGQIATWAGVVAALLGVVAGYLLAERAPALLRLAPALLLAVASPIVGAAVAWFFSTYPVGLGPVAALLVCDAIGVLGVSFGVVFAVHLLSLRVQTLSALEPVLIIASVVSIFADHRHHRIEHPRFLSDWAWSAGIDPVSVLSVLGVVGALLAALMLLRGPLTRGVVGALLLIGALLLLLPSTARLPPPPPGAQGDSSSDSPDKDDSKGDGKDGRGQSERPPHPVAIVVLHDELPAELDALYLRQSVLSRLSGDRMVDDNSGAFDRDIVAQLPTPESKSLQNPQFHRKLHTSIYLLTDQSALFGPAQPY